MLSGMGMDIKWEKRFINIAREISTWSKDPSKQIGAVITGVNKQIISQGYNGFPKGFDDLEYRLKDREQKLKYIVHAEANAIYNALHNGANLSGATIYVYGLPPCHECAKAIIQCGISKVVYHCDGEGLNKWKESFAVSEEMFKECNVECYNIAYS